MRLFQFETSLRHSKKRFESDLTTVTSISRSNVRHFANSALEKDQQADFAGKLQGGWSIPLGQCHWTSDML
jgi:hypothetical protein